MVVKARDIEAHKYNFGFDKLEVQDTKFDPIEVLRQIIDQIVEWTTNTADDLDKSISTIVNNVIDRMFDHQLEHTASLDAIYENALDVVRQQRTVGECVDQLLATLLAIREKAKTELQQCVQNGVSQVQELINDLQANVGAIRDEVVVIKNIVTECQASGGSDSQIALCVLRKVSSIECEKSFKIRRSSL